MLSLIAGAETTASVMRITFLCLISSPPVYYKLKEVVKEAVKSGTVTEPISYARAKEIPYLRVSPPFYVHRFSPQASKASDGDIKGCCA